MIPNKCNNPKTETTSKSRRRIFLSDISKCILALDFIKKGLNKYLPNISIFLLEFHLVLFALQYYKHATMTMHKQMLERLVAWQHDLL